MKEDNKSFIVLGSGWGDEGKGMTTDYLSNEFSFLNKFYDRKNLPNSLVIRFSGGHQAGHTVVTKDDVRHVFSTHGAGTLSGHPTYWSSYCTFLVDAVLKEHKALIKKGVQPKLYVDAFAPVTTFYDYMLNQFKEKSKGDKKHGSCGVGFGTTVKRSNKTPYTFFVEDLLNPEIIRQKIKSVGIYYEKEIKNLVLENPSIPQSLIDDHTINLDFDKAIEMFIEKVEELLPMIEIVSEKQFFAENIFDNYVFEGSQGILLDQTFGLTYPHVTMSNTTSENAIEIIKRNNLPEPHIFYATRCYQTRHGNGWMSNESRPIKLKNNEKETNVLNEYQGNFRTGVLDIDMLKKSIMIDNKFSYGFLKSISITCLDQVEDDKKIPYTVNGELKEGDVQKIISEIGEKFFYVLTSKSDKPSEIKKSFFISQGREKNNTL